MKAGVNFIIRFENVYFEFKEQWMSLPDSVMEFMFLTGIAFNDMET